MKDTIKAQFCALNIGSGTLIESISITPKKIEGWIVVVNNDNVITQGASLIAYESDLTVRLKPLESNRASIREQAETILGKSCTLAGGVLPITDTKVRGRGLTPSDYNLVLDEYYRTGKLATWPGENKIVKEEHVSKSIAEIDKEPLSPGREYTERELSLIPDIPATHIVTATENRMLAMILYNKGTYRFRNFFIEGASATGKSRMCKALANRLNIPYMHLTIGPDSDKYELRHDIKTGAVDGRLTAEEVDSVILEAYEKGYLLEIQESARRFVVKSYDTVSKRGGGISHQN